MKRLRKRKSAKISDAVFRGRKGEYTFEVYPLAAEIPETPAVFILSRRKVHRTGHVSHAASCIGETESVTAELKKHKRAKCVKQNLSNVICILRDESDKGRTAVLDDIAGARSFGCVRNVFEPTMLRKPNVQPISVGQAMFDRAVPSVPLPLKPVRRKRVEAVSAKQPDEDKNTKSARGSTAGNGKPAGIGSRRVGKNSRNGVSSPHVSEGSLDARAKRRAVSSKPAKPSARTKTTARSAKLEKTVRSAKPAKTAGRSTAKRANTKEIGTRQAKVTVTAKKRAAAKPRTRVQGRVDRDRGQHRLPKQKRAAAGRSKTRAAGRTGARKKAAA